MRRLSFVFISIIMIFLLCVPAFAAGGRLYAEYVPRTERGTLFYVDVFSDDSLSAAVIEAEYDSGLVEFRAAAADSGDADIQTRDDGGRLTVVIAGSDGTGRLCRLTFKALGSGTAEFTFNMRDGVDSDLRRLSGAPAYILSVEFSDGGEVQTSAGGRTSASSRSGSSSTRGSSAHSGTSSSKSASADEESVNVRGAVVHDISTPEDSTYFLIGAGSAVIAVLLILLGFMFGRGRKMKNGLPKNSGEEIAEDPADEIPYEEIPDISDDEIPYE